MAEKKETEEEERACRLQEEEEHDEEERRAIGPNAITRDQYFEFYHRVCKVLVPDYQCVG